MTPTAAPPADLPVTSEQVTEIAAQVWESFLGLSLVEAGAGCGLPGSAMAGVVAISGAWAGSVVVGCSSDHAVQAAEAMFAAEPGSLEPAEVADALGELTNMVGGNIKSLLPEPSALSIPSVTGGVDHQVFVPGALRVLQVELHCGTAPVVVTLWQS